MHHLASRQPPCPLVSPQGYNLDYMSNEDLGELIGSLTQVRGHTERLEQLGGPTLGG